MMREYRIFLSLFIVLLPVAASAAERDILEIAKERPPKVFVNGVPGDPKLAAAVDALADIPHPWTVPTIIEVFDKGNLRVAAEKSGGSDVERNEQ
jgi:hypothetical protein